MASTRLPDPLAPGRAPTVGSVLAGGCATVVVQLGAFLATVAALDS